MTLHRVRKSIKSIRRGGGERSPQQTIRSRGKGCSVGAEDAVSHLLIRIETSVPEKVRATRFAGPPEHKSPCKLLICEGFFFLWF